MSNKNKNNKNKNNENEDNISFLYDNNEKREDNKKNNKRKSGLEEYGNAQKSLISNEALTAVLATSSFFKNISNTWDKTPFQIKMGYIFILGTLLYYFLIMNFNLYYSIAFSILLFLIFFLINPYVGIIFIIIIALIIYNQHHKKVRASGTLIKETEINKNKPYDAQNDSLTIESKRFPKQMTTGLFGYSFWLFLNKSDSNDELYRNDEWKSVFYRGTEMEDKSDISTLTQYLGVWLTPYNESLAFVFQQNGGNTESFELNNIEFNSWNHFYVGVSPHSINIYKNGKLEVSSAIKQSPIVSDDFALYITSDDAVSKLGSTSNGESEDDDEGSGTTGFDGHIAYITYYEYSLNPNEIEDSMKVYEDKINEYEKYRKSKIEDVIIYPLDLF